MPNLVARHIKKFGYIPDLPDHRDRRLALAFDATPLPPVVDLRPHMPPVYDQGQLGSCTGNAIAAAVQYERMRQGIVDAVKPSRLFIYYNERVIEHTVGFDAGAQIRDGIKSVAKLGVCPETLWPYKIAKFATKPPASAYKAALAERAVTYARVMQSAAAMTSCLAKGFPFVIGFTVYDSFESSAVAKSGVVNLPGPQESVIGGHAVLVVGYDRPNQRFIVRNSWGTSWGQKGYFTVPFAYFANNDLADDLWNITLELTA